MTRTRLAASVLALGVVLTVLGGGAGSAQAATGYRYWSFWVGDGGKWTYATQGPAGLRPADGDVIGFRFSVSEDSQESAKPRRAAGFDAICGKSPESAKAGSDGGSKRIALVIDPGTAADAPAGEQPPALRTACARVGADATSADALASVAKPLRYNSGALLCAISGYPKTGCGEQVSDGGADMSARPAISVKTDDGNGSGPSAGLLVGLAAVLGLGAAGVWRARRRRG
ncbi:hypothetical protein J7I98_03275 [Streptomyces sp. ISL-98]|uniref:SCO2322 family protein n=1 Tax=Streptomyces sp. ISL-98 TaxID=2819192 RepID=UPI001BEB6EA5|nr:SCO2322 family protein [Streptomyces sp. ISL-98]MBT2504932.1 hypothetical protein [Streptomyces sp. ISL-98]